MFSSYLRDGKEGTVSTDLIMRWRCLLESTQSFHRGSRRGSDGCCPANGPELERLLMGSLPGKAVSAPSYSMQEERDREGDTQINPLDLAPFNIHHFAFIPYILQDFSATECLHSKEHLVQAQMSTTPISGSSEAKNLQNGIWLKIAPCSNISSSSKQSLPVSVHLSPPCRLCPRSPGSACHCTAGKSSSDQCLGPEQLWSL